MEILEKLNILGAAAKYDVSCSSSGSKRPNKAGGMGNGCAAGICHSWADDGRCISLLKVLFTNFCIHDCAYCVNRRTNDVQRTAFTVDELVELTINFYRRNYIEGLFLSSGVIKNADYTMEQLIGVAKKLRAEQNFNGYIHLKAIPGASRELINEAGLWADRLSVNIELPSEQSLTLLTDKKKDDIVKPMKQIGSSIIENREDRRHFRKAPVFAPAGQSTQIIIGATPETDRQIVKLSENLYDRFSMKRVYYSAFVPVSSDNRLPALAIPPLRREHRLYQADWLLRFYGFNADELLSDANPNLDETIDPKANWALHNIHLFPIEVNTADYEMLLRVPGIGVLSAKRIVMARRFARLNLENIKKLGVTMKRARYFITCGGVSAEKKEANPRLIKLAIENIDPVTRYHQLSLF